MLKPAVLGISLAAMAAFGAHAQAQAPTLDDKAYVEAVATISIVDHFKAKCTGLGALPADAAAKLSKWEAANEAPVIRRSIVEVRKDPTEARRIDGAVGDTVKQFESMNLPPCMVLAAVLDLPDAQLAKRHPDLLVRLRPTGGADASSTITAKPAAPSPALSAPAPSAPDSSTELASLIEGFAFDWNMRMGFGGAMTVNTFPVVLFKNGEALTDVEGLAMPGGVTAHKRAHAKDWTQWRRAGGKLQTLKDGKWDDLGYNVVYSKLPTGFKLEGRYTRLSGSGNIAMGGTDSVAVISTYDFFRDGTVIRGGAVGAVSQFGDASVVANTVSADKRGKYRIEGVTLHIAYDNGAMEAMILVTDPKEPNVIWLDGYGYTSKD